MIHYVSKGGIMKLGTVPKKSSQFLLHYHKHPNHGGVGHISIEATHNDETAKLSIYPDSELSVFTPILIMSMFIFPSRAVNKESLPEDGSPIHATHDITDQVENKNGAFERIKEYEQAINKGVVAFSLTPNTMTHLLAVFLNPQTSFANIHYGFKTFDRDKVDTEMNRVQITNCADSASSVLKAAGISSPPSILSYATPTGINRVFDLSPCSGDTNTPPEQKDKTSSNSESLGFFSKLSITFRDFFNTKSVDESPISSTSNSEGCSAHESDKESHERAEASSPNTSESSFSFFATSNDDKASCLTRNEGEEDLSYVQRMDALVGGNF